MIQLGDFPANARVNRADTFNFVLRMELHNAQSVTVNLGVYASSYVLPVYVAGQRRSNPSLMLGLLALSSHDGTVHPVDVVRSYCFEMISLLLFLM